jgi:hypothetical protein
MVINCAIVAGSLVLGLTGPGAPGVARARQFETVVAVTDSFAPTRPKKHRSTRSSPKASQPAAARDQPEATADIEQDWTPSPQRQPAPVSTRRRVEAADTDDKNDDKDKSGDDDKAPVKVRRRATAKKVVDEDADGEEQDAEDEAEEPLHSLPAIMPRLVWFSGGASALGRTFQFNTALQKESTFPRPGVAMALEAYPLIRMPRGWFKTIGIGASYALELGSAALLQNDGSAVSYPVRQQRWSVDVRYAIPLGERVVVIPALGYASSMFDLQRMTPVPPSQCTNALMQPCLADVQTSALAADAHVRIAVTSELGLGASIGYLVGVGLGKSASQIGSEAGSATWSGYHGQVDASYLVSEWLALRFEVPFVSQSYKFSGGTTTYSSASESYYGVVFGAAVFSR